jgi:hypothetical protein
LSQELEKTKWAAAIISKNTFTMHRKEFFKKNFMKIAT